jgi:cytochrome c-type biogenesis protein
MIDTLIVTVNQWMAGGIVVAAAGCFLWGMVSVFFSPCHLASIPLIVAYVGGQNRVLRFREAIHYSVTFSMGLFTTIAFVGIICAVLGRMLGDVGLYWQIPVGLVLIWVALGMFDVGKCSMSGNFLQGLNLRGLPGALVLGLAFGVLSGSCTFGFIAPILAVITIQQEIATGILFIFLFALGHIIPIAIAGSSTAAVRKVMENARWQEASIWFRKGAGTVIAGLAVYFIVSPFVSK